MPRRRASKTISAGWGRFAAGGFMKPLPHVAAFLAGAALGAGALFVVLTDSAGRADRVVVPLDDPAPGAELATVRDERDRLQEELSMVQEARNDALAMLAEVRDRAEERARRLRAVNSTSMQVSLHRDALVRALAQSRREVGRLRTAMQSAESQARQADATSTDNGFAGDGVTRVAARTRDRQRTGSADPGANGKSPHPDERLKLGVRAYREGDFEHAYRLWMPLARQGSAWAQFYVGALYFEGRGVDPDAVRAYYWLAKARAENHEQAADLLRRVREDMSGNQIAAARSLLQAGAAPGS